MELVILVDNQDNEIGQMEKLQAHVEGKLHRAFSVFVFNTKGEVMLQKRAAEKYHSPLLWTNTCCSHPRPNESTKDAAIRRLDEEMGFHCSLQNYFSFIYNVKFSNELIEHEFDHVFIGFYNDSPSINTNEVCEWKWLDWNLLLNDIEINPNDYTFWLKECINEMKKKLFNPKRFLFNCCEGE
jgi:isopentenyl-diphosphate delta-isomerase